MDNNKDFGTLEKLCEDILNDMDTYDSILLGFGTELLKYKNDGIDDVLACLAKYLEHKNYFIISSVKDDILRNSELNQKRIVCPYLGETDKTNEDKQWDLYNKWLSGTLAKKLLVVELGEGFNNPNLASMIIFYVFVGNLIYYKCERRFWAKALYIFLLTTLFYHIVETDCRTTLLLTAFVVISFFLTNKIRTIGKIMIKKIVP